MVSKPAFCLLLIASFRNLEKIKFKTIKILLLIFIFLEYLVIYIVILMTKICC